MDKETVEWLEATKNFRLSEYLEKFKRERDFEKLIRALDFGFNLSHEDDVMDFIQKEENKEDAFKAIVRIIKGKSKGEPSNAVSFLSCLQMPEAMDIFIDVLNSGNTKLYMNACGGILDMLRTGVRDKRCIKFQLRVAGDTGLDEDTRLNARSALSEFEDSKLVEAKGKALPQYPDVEEEKEG